jgi:hypothetical protein
MSVDRNLLVDKFNQLETNYIKLMGRTLFPPFGWFDKRAEKAARRGPRELLFMNPELKGGR